MSQIFLQKQLAAAHQVLADLLQEKFPSVYVVESEGLNPRVLAIRLSIESAKSFLELRAGRELEWRYGDTHDGGMWWPARDAAGVITSHKVVP